MPSFRVDDGVVIHYEQWAGGPAAAPAGPTGPPVLLHHGFVADHTSNWVRTGFVGALVAAGRDVVALDARGHGRSDKPHSPSSYGEHRMAQDLSMLADVLGLEQFDLVGYSMGAVVSLLVATTPDPRLRRLAVGGVGAGVGAGVLRFGGVDRSVLEPGLVAGALLTEDVTTITDPAAARFRAFADVTGADRFALSAHLRAVRDQSVALDRIAVPTLLFVGTADDLATEPGQLVDAIPGARLVEFDGDHLSVLGDPKLTGTVVAFLAE